MIKPKKNNLLHISANIYPPLPTSHHTMKIWAELSRDFDEYHVLARSEDLKFKTTIDGKIHLHSVPGFGTRQMSFFFVSLLLPFYLFRIKPVLVISQCPVLGGFSAALYKFIFSYKLFVEIHGEHYFTATKSGFIGKLHHAFFRYCSYFTFRKSDKIRTLSSDMTKTLADRYGDAYLDKIVVIPNRVNLSVFSEVKANYQVNGPLKIITVGRFSTIKNHKNLIKDLASSSTDFHLTIVGFGSLKAEYTELSKSLNIEDKLTVLENLSHAEIAKTLPNMDLYIHYSLTEGVPRAIIEAMSCGLPVISTNVGYISDLLFDKVNAIILNKPYSFNLVSALKLILSSAEFRQKLGLSARKTIYDNFEWNNVFDKYRAELRGCINGDLG